LYMRRFGVSSAIALLLTFRSWHVACARTLSTELLKRNRQEMTSALGYNCSTAEERLNSDTIHK
jgi:hypothetical protein